MSPRTLMIGFLNVRKCGVIEVKKGGDWRNVCGAKVLCVNIERN